MRERVAEVQEELSSKESLAAYYQEQASHLESDLREATAHANEVPPSTVLSDYIFDDSETSVATQLC